MKHGWGKRGVGILIVIAAAGGGWAAYQRYEVAAQPQQAARRPPPVPVVATPVVRKAVPVELGAIGTVQPIETAIVKSRVDGQIAKVHIRDGAIIKAGDPLFTLDSRAIATQVRQAEAQLARDQAQLENARRESTRQRALASKAYATAAVYDTARTSAMALEATVASDQAMLETLKVQAGYYTIVSPIDGRAGAITLKEGNNVKAVDTLVLVTINKTRPIYVGFSLPQDRLGAIQDAMRSHNLEVTAQVAGTDAVERGKLAFVDNAIDPATGTIALKGIFDNEREPLWPGQLVSASLTLRIDSAALVVPTQAIQLGPTKSYVYVVKADETVEERTVTRAAAANGESVIASGLQEGEQVVVDGQIRLANGSAVAVRPMLGDATAGSGS
ncbi:MAG: mdtA2 [Rhodospirillales bacterium]|nr:mdtA2 [Rhodospirillales bacterium]